MFKVNNKDTRTTSSTYFANFSSVSIFDFEQVHNGQVSSKRENKAENWYEMGQFLQNIGRCRSAVTF